jgi:3-hydroxyethyl bacteriochlorophyllide a dehydrogenase
MDTLAVVLEKPQRLSLTRIEIDPPGDADAVVDIEFSGISTGTERLLWSGRMPHFPGMGYPLVPGYESVGRVAVAGPASGFAPGERVFVPGANCYGPVRGLFGGAASRVVVPGARLARTGDALGENAVLLALAATAYHALKLPGAELPGLIVGHGVLGMLMARLTVALGGDPVVWERQPSRMQGDGYAVLAPDDDRRRDYPVAYDVSGDPTILDQLVMRLARQGEIILAGFYSEKLSFTFPPAFMKEARIRIAAQWQPSDLAAVLALAETGRLSLEGLITHRMPAADAPSAYDIAFSDPACLKMILDWSTCS